MALEAGLVHHHADRQPAGQGNPPAPAVVEHGDDRLALSQRLDIEIFEVREVGDVVAFPALRPDA